LETLADGIVIDVGHTPDAIAAAKAGFLAAHKAGVLVCGVSQDKPAGPILTALARGFSPIILTRARHKGTPPAALLAHARAAAPDAEFICADDAPAARDLALARGGTIYVAGSLFLAAEFKALAEGRDPAGLYFF
jgi:folylpolyglutamate synthase/dihydropteroate synthase